MLGSEVENASPTPREKKRIVILGGGFAGMRTAECLEKQLRRDPAVSIALVSETNALLFTPMLAEVAGGSLEPSHISTPLRSSLHRTEFIRGRVGAIDLEARRVILETDHAPSEDSSRREIPYDQLVLALGSVSNYLGMANIEKLAFNFKSLLDAIRIRNHVIEMFERADREPDFIRRTDSSHLCNRGRRFRGRRTRGGFERLCARDSGRLSQLASRGPERGAGSCGRPHPARTKRVIGTLCTGQDGSARSYFPPEYTSDRCESRSRVRKRR